MKINNFERVASYREKNIAHLNHAVRKRCSESAKNNNNI